MPYHQFETDDLAFGSFEVFVGDGSRLYEDDDEPNEILEDGKFYWWACYAGCLPDSDPNGPFDSEELAIADANSPYQLGYEKPINLK